MMMTMTTIMPSTIQSHGGFVLVGHLTVCLYACGMRLVDSNFFFFFFRGPTRWNRIIQYSCMHLHSLVNWSVDDDDERRRAIARNIHTDNVPKANGNHRRTNDFNSWFSWNTWYWHLPSQFAYETRRCVSNLDDYDWKWGRQHRWQHSAMQSEWSIDVYLAIVNRQFWKVHTRMPYIVGTNNGPLFKYPFTSLSILKESKSDWRKNKQLDSQPVNDKLTLRCLRSIDLSSMLRSFSCRRPVPPSAHGCVCCQPNEPHLDGKTRKCRNFHSINKLAASRRRPLNWSNFICG